MKKQLLFLAITMIFIANFAVAQTYVAPGDGTLSQAIADAQDGDVLELVPEGLYTESVDNTFGTLVNKDLIIKVEGDEPLPAKLQLLSQASGENTPIFFLVGDSASLTLIDLELDGSFNGISNAEYLIQFYMGEFPAPTFIENIVIIDCYIHHLTSDVIAAGNSEMRGNVVIDNTLINNCIFENTGTSVYYKYGGANLISVTNSTFNTILSYGFRIAGPAESNLPNNTPTVIIDQTTWYNIGTEDGREIILCEKGPHQGFWSVSNSILVKQINKDKVVINIKETVTDEQAMINNICLWDVGTINWRNHPVSDTLTMDPQFLDPDNGDFTLPAGSPLLSYGSDGGPIGDPRWAKNASAVASIENSVPADFSLMQNYPNPFNPTTTIRFTLAKTENAVLTVYDLLGRKVAVLVNNKLDAGDHSISFDASDLSSGIYIYRLQTEAQTLTKKMTLLQ
ncbi:T9SS type A sorting domain-containing protein [candidate division KSB1 bacterium]|nr:T9SS type A sorting domain-containing protein [candidate division KSB1 bacterium]